MGAGADERGGMADGGGEDRVDRVPLAGRERVGPVVTRPSARRMIERSRETVSVTCRDRPRREEVLLWVAVFVGGIGSEGRGEDGLMVVVARSVPGDVLVGG